MSEASCEQVLREIEAYLDGELPDDQRGVLEEHVGACSHCFDRQEFRRAVQEIVRRKCASEEPPADLYVRIRRTVFRSE